jgi:nicotinamide-nucleotide amidase
VEGVVNAALHDLSDFEPAVLALAAALRSRGWRIAAAESCTGGLIAAACTSVAGSSDWFERGFVTYSNEAKVEMLQIREPLLASFGAVSAEAAAAMALGALANSRADWSIAVTGIAGPGGATPGKPVGTVWLAIARRGEPSARVQRLQLEGDRAAVRGQTAAQALAALQAAVSA